MPSIISWYSGIYRLKFWAIWCPKNSNFFYHLALHQENSTIKQILKGKIHKCNPCTISMAWTPLKCVLAWCVPEKYLFWEPTHIGPDFLQLCQKEYHYHSVIRYLWQVWRVSSVKKNTLKIIVNVFIILKISP